MNVKSILLMVAVLLCAASFPAAAAEDYKRSDEREAEAALVAVGVLLAGRALNVDAGTLHIGSWHSWRGKMRKQEFNPGAGLILDINGTAQYRMGTYLNSHGRQTVYAGGALLLGEFWGLRMRGIAGLASGYRHARGMRSVIPIGMLEFSHPRTGARVGMSAEIDEGRVMGALLTVSLDFWNAGN